MFLASGDSHQCENNLTYLRNQKIGHQFYPLFFEREAQ